MVCMHVVVLPHARAREGVHWQGRFRYFVCSFCYCTTTMWEVASTRSRQETVGTRASKQSEAERHAAQANEEVR